MTFTNILRTPEYDIVFETSEVSIARSGFAWCYPEHVPNFTFTSYFFYLGWIDNSSYMICRAQRKPLAARSSLATEFFSDRLATILVLVNAVAFGTVPLAARVIYHFCFHSEGIGSRTLVLLLAFDIATSNVNPLPSRTASCGLEVRSILFRCILRFNPCQDFEF